MENSAQLDRRIRLDLLALERSLLCCEGLPAMASACRAVGVPAAMSGSPL